MKISEVMQREVISANIDMSVQEVGRLLASEGIGGAPILSSDGQVKGIISRSDLINALAERSDEGLMIFSDPTVKVWEIMTQKVLKVEADDDLQSVAQKMRDDHVHRVLVYDGGELVGIATSFDLVCAFADPGSSEQ
jgi:CBS domain-containing protein